MSDWPTIRQRLAGKWQIPFFLGSLLVLGAVTLRLRPKPTDLAPEAAAEFFNSMVKAGLYEGAIEGVDAFLTQEREVYKPNELAPVHVPLARALVGLALGDGRKSASLATQIEEHYRLAAAGGVKLAPEDLVGSGYAREWQGDVGGAVEYFDRAVDAGADHATDLRRHALDLSDARLSIMPGDLYDKVVRFMAAMEDERLDVRIWAVELALNLLHEDGRDNEANTLVLKEYPRFRGSDFQNQFEYLQALLLHRTGNFDQAETALRTLRNRLDRSDPIDAKAAWLLGRVVLSDGGPQRPMEALSFFDDVIGFHPDGVYAVASRVGMGEALAMLDRHDDAISTFRIALEYIPTLPRNRVIDIDVLRATLRLLAEGQRMEQRLQPAVDYMRMAADLADRSNEEQVTSILKQAAALYTARADELDLLEEVELADRSFGESTEASSSKDARELYAEAAEAYLKVSKINTLNELVSSDASWRAATLMSKAGRRYRAVELFRSFVLERPTDTRLPRALLRVGQLLQIAGDLDAAIESFQECYRRFPRTLEGSRALVPLAQCYLQKGPGSEDLAQKTLSIVLDDSEVFTPQAPEFVSAMYLMGDVWNRVGEFERSVSVLEEFLTRYGKDARVLRARYLLADSYRQSALALRGEAKDVTFAGELKQIGEESKTRFRRAGDLYRSLIDEYEIKGLDQLHPLESMYLRHAHLYEADAYFETQDYSTALTLYEEAAATFNDSVSALAAYVQVINCYVFLGQPSDARAALARARLLVDGMAQSTFDKSLSPETRDDWKRYFSWLGESTLF